MGVEYDNSAFLYFAISMMSMVVFPWTIYTLYIIASYFLCSPSSSNPNEALLDMDSKNITPSCAKSRRQSKQTLFTRNFTGAICLLLVFWGIIFYMLSLIQLAPDVLQFNPYELLGIEETDDLKIIKKAYRTLAKELHPDVNPSPVAEEKFATLAKAYKTLTDSDARENWLKHGNPDGPQPMSVSIGLPSFVLESDYMYLVIGVYLIGLVILIPILVFTWYNRTSKYGATDVQIESYQFYQNLLNDHTNIKNIPEVLAASSEFKDFYLRLFTPDIYKLVTNKARLLGIVKPYPPKHGFKAALNHPRIAAIHRNTVLIHMWLNRDELKPTQLFSDQDMEVILSKSMRLCEAMIEIVANPRMSHLTTTLNIIEFMQMITQRMWVKDSHLLQLPHFGPSEIKHASSGKKNAVKTLRDYIQLSADNRKGMLSLSEDQKKSVCDVIAHLPNLDVSVQAYVEDEEDIFCSDVVTLEVSLTRLNVSEGEVARPVFAPYFPEKDESWWILLASQDEPNRIQPPFGIKKVVSLERCFTVKDLKIIAPSKAGSYNYVIYVKSADYVGLDIVKNVTVTVKPSEDAPVVDDHPDDLALDSSEPTLFQMMKGQLEDSDDNSSDEEDGGDSDSDEE